MRHSDESMGREDQVRARAGGGTHCICILCMYACGCAGRVADAAAAEA